MMATVSFWPIGFVRSPHQQASEGPIQPCFAKDVRGQIEILPDCEVGLEGIEGFSHLWLIYHLHEAPPPALVVKPFLSDTPTGIFACRHPARPNPIGMSLVRLVARQGRLLEIADVDLLDGTPILDIKPYVPQFDRADLATGGWVDRVPSETALQRGRKAGNIS